MALAVSGSEDEIVSLADCLDRAAAAMWPRRAHQELLLDLGERKQWDLAIRRRAVDEAAAWLVRELQLPPSYPVTRDGARAVVDEDQHARAVARSLGRVAGLSAPIVGVATWACGIAPALGSSAKTLANSLSGPLRADRGDHRWLRVIAGTIRGRPHSDAWCFHRRCPETMARMLGSLAGKATFDAGDALVVLSLLALWQRRRPTTKARGNRGRRESRRATPKPVAALIGGLAQPLQAVALVNLATHLEPAAGRALAELAIEAALTEAHLAPHPTRSVSRGRGSATSGESWLAAAEAALRETGSLVPDEDRAVFCFRVDRQRAWRARRSQSVVDEDLRRHPYVGACLALEQTIINPEAENTPLAPATPGLLMLVPALRSRGLLEST